MRTNAQLAKLDLLILDKLGYVPASKLGSQRLTGAVLDRLTHHCHILEATGESYRLKDARKRSSNRNARSKKSNQGN